VKERLHLKDKGGRKVIDKAFDFLKKEIYGYLARIPELNVKNQEIVKVSSLLKLNGETELPSNVIGLTLVNVEEERVLKSQTTAVVDEAGRVSHLNPEIKLNLYMLVTANFTNYPTALEHLSAVIRFFQAKSVFTSKNSPLLPDAISKLMAELYTLSLEQQNHLWGALGSKYMPSVLYRLRLLAIQEGLKSDDQMPTMVINFESKGI
jgi:hypothetical protein